jgi:tetratricopeptide (TPR) repeat protein
LLQQLAALGEQASKRREQAQAQALRVAAEEVRGKRYGEALKTLSQCRPDQLGAAWLWRYRLLHAQALLGTSQAAAALDELDGIVFERLSSAERAAVHMARLDAAMALQQLARAQAEIDTLTALVKDDQFLGPTVALRAVEVATLRKDREAARRLALAAKQAYPKFASAHEFDLLLARNALASVQFDEARRILSDLLAVPPEHDPSAVPRANWLLGETYFLAQDYRQAIAAYTAAIDSNAAPAWTEISLMQRAKCYELLGELTAATADYERVAADSKRSSFTMTAQTRLNQIDNYLRSASAASKSKLK